ncbi:MAG: hypothetical protein H6P94_304 [Thermoplasmatales archaeon]|jgi:hypothetical protein|nr:hypothetical protein [Thermoplasmatales archaeon]
MEATEQTWSEEQQRQRLLKAMKFFFLITILYSLWITLVIMGVYYLHLGNQWAYLSMEQWILTAIGLISIAIGVECVLLLQYILTKRKTQEPAEPKKQKEYIQGKQVHSITIPMDAKGGIFSKTYILIDEDRVLNIRYQMIPPNDLWGQQQ